MIKTTYQAEGFPAEKRFQRTSDHPYTHAAVRTWVSAENKHYERILGCSTSAEGAEKLGRRALRGCYSNIGTKNESGYKVVRLLPIKGGPKDGTR